MKRASIRIAVVGVGNCASSLLQGLAYYATQERRAPTGRPLPGLLNNTIQGYAPSDIQVVAAFDVDARKVGRPLERACFAPPNCTLQFYQHLPRYGITVQMGPVLDGIASHMHRYPAKRTFVVAKKRPVDVRRVLRQSGAEILLNYLPVGSERA
ncbi:MAG: hypothetical protein HY597_04615 [Candidatus Omnitrophica bacterium]|nr:hypothetical protein [Candidatus Omnitrophota bacterium]